jgi:hypothetical protein
MINSMKNFLSELFFNIFGSKGKFCTLKNNTAIVSTETISKEKCAMLREKIDELIAISSNLTRIQSDDLGSDIRIWEFENHIQEKKDLFNIDENIENISNYLGLRYTSWTLMANKVSVEPENKGSGGGWHRDSPFSHQLKLIWYLSDVSTENGPFEYVPGTNVTKNKINREFPIGSYRYAQMPYPSIKVTGSSGDLLICDTKCIHRGMPIRAGIRYAVTLYTFKNNAKKRAFLDAV